MKNIPRLMVLLIALMALVACSNKADDAVETPAKELDNSYDVTHAMGTTTVNSAKKIVILTNEGIEALLSMDVTPIGAVQSSQGTKDEPWYPHLKEQLADVAVVGTESEVNLEAIAKLQPDLIIGNKMRQEKIYDQLSAIAPTVFSETLRGEWQDNFKLYAKAINEVEHGDQVLQDYNDHVASVKTALGDKTKQEISMVRFMPGDVRIYHKDTFSGVILDQLGFARPAEQNVDDFAERNLTKERIPAMDGDVIFYFVYETGDNEATNAAKDWIEDPLFKNLSAAKAGNVHQVNDTIWNTAGGVLAANLMLDEVADYFTK